MIRQDTIHWILNSTSTSGPGDITGEKKKDCKSNTNTLPYTFLHHHTPTSRHSPLDAPFCSSRFVIIHPLHHVSFFFSYNIHISKLTTTSATPLDSSH
jgi:hypothetical protein